MDYGHEDIGPALKRLREAADLPQKQLAAKIQRSGANVSRIERSGSNPKMESVVRYLRAIGADLGDLHRELRESDDPLEDAVASVNQRIRKDPEYRRLAKSMLERFGGPEPPPALRAMADLIDRQGDEIEQQADQISQQSEQMEDYAERLRCLETERSSAGEESPLADLMERSAEG